MIDENHFKTAEEISKAVNLQNSAILRTLLFPQVCQRQSGYFEDPHGQTIYVDANGITHRPHDPDNLNGWTV